MSLPNSRIWMRLRARSIKGVKVINKRSFTYLHCRYCKEGCQETQEHLEERQFWEEGTGLFQMGGEGDVLVENDCQACCYCCPRLGHFALPPLCDSIIPAVSWQYRVDDTINNKQFKKVWIWGLTPLPPIWTESILSYIFFNVDLPYMITIIYWVSRKRKSNFEMYVCYLYFKCSKGQTDYFERGHPHS